MKSRILWLILSILMALSLVLASCAEKAEEEEEEGVVVEEEEEEEEEEEGPPPTGNWWDKWGEPQYGGSLIYSYAFVDVICDPAADPRPSQFGAYMEWLFCDNMLTDREEYAFQASWAPLKYQQGWMAESWELTDPLTITVKIHEGITWHNRPPTNGREFTADDVVYGYDRALGTGSGFTTPNPFFAPGLASIERAVAVDKYTVQFKLKAPNPMAIYAIVEPSLRFGYTAPEWMALDEQKKQDYNYVVGTGPFMLVEFVPGTSISFDRNPDYWGYDERHPQNRLPYLEHWKVLAIPDMSTQIAALRTGKVDMIVDGRTHVSADQAESIKRTNPEIQLLYWQSSAGGATFKYGAEPFDDINVRKAMQMAIDTQTIADVYYRGLGDPTPEGMASPLLGADWADPYEDWPKELQDEYKYNPEGARELLAEAGYPTGFKTDILFSAQDDMNLCLLLKDYFNQIGVDMEIVARDPITARMMSLSGKYDQMTFGGGGIAGAPQDTITNFWSEKLERRGAVDDPTYDAFVDEFFAATTIEECQRIFKEASRYVVEQHWYIQLGRVKTCQVYQPWIKGWAGENLWSVPQWAYYARMWIDMDMKKSMGH